ncbi:unnamed protein product [Alopecurus aequalis]
MSMSALLSALRDAGRQQISASTIATRQATGSHLLRIDGYTQVCKMVGKGTRMRSDTISVGGHDWRISCYPNGYSQKDEGSHISLLLDHASQSTEPFTVKAQASILDQAGMPSYTQTMPFSFSLHFGWSEFISHEDLDKEKHLKDDSLTILRGGAVPACLHGLRCGHSVVAMQFLSSPGNLEAVVASDEFELLKTGCPNALLELLAEKVMRQED